jgi:hypothetical protein
MGRVEAKPSDGKLDPKKGMEADAKEPRAS